MRVSVTATFALVLSLAAVSLGACVDGGPRGTGKPDDKGPIPRIELADVTPVWPLVTVDDHEASGFIVAGMNAGHGVVFPRDVFDSTPALTRVDEPDAI